MKETKFRLWYKDYKEYKEIEDLLEKIKKLFPRCYRNDHLVYPDFEGWDSPCNKDKLYIAFWNEYRHLLTAGKKNLTIIKQGKMYYDGFVIYPENGLCEFPEGGWDLKGRTESPNDCILMQYTGLKDINDKEIYEGDIVLYPDDNNPAEVVYNPPVFETRDIKTGDLGDLFKTIMKVIGNIYENPELLQRGEIK